MKLWRVVQWGNPDDGPDGHDTQCVISAVSLPQAVEKAKEDFVDWKRGQVDVVYLIGADERPDGPPVVVIPRWVASAYNPGDDASWCQNSSGEWVDSALVYG